VQPQDGAGAGVGAESSRSTAAELTILSKRRQHDSAAVS